MQPTMSNRQWIGVFISSMIYIDIEDDITDIWIVLSGWLKTEIYLHIYYVSVQTS